MGNEVDYLDREGAADPIIVQKLRGIPGLADAGLLARLIDGHAGFDINARLFGLEAERRELRVKLRPLLQRLRGTALEISQIGQDDRDIWPVELAMADLLEGTNWHDLARAQKCLEMIENFSLLPVQADDAGFGGAPELDRPVTRVVAAVADYCARMGIPFTGEPRREQTDRGPDYIAKSEAAKLTGGAQSRRR